MEVTTSRVVVWGGQRLQPTTSNTGRSKAAVGGGAARPPW